MPKEKSRVWKGNKTVDVYVSGVLEPEGWVCAVAGRRTRFGGEDFFGASEGPGFDIFAFKGKQILLVQVKLSQARTAFTEMNAWWGKNKAEMPDCVTLRLAVLRKATKTRPLRWSERDIK